MGYYIQTGTRHDKAEIIAFEHAGVVLGTHPKTFADIPDDKALVVVVDNGPFEAAALAYNAAARELFGEFAALNNIRVS